MDFGAFVEILPGKDGLVHISELADYRVPKVEDVVKVGDEITVKVIDIDDLGRVRLSRRAVLEKRTELPGASESDSVGTNSPFRRPHRDGFPEHRPGNRQRPRS